MELKEYISLVRRWYWLLMLGIILGATGGFGFSWFQTPVYQATTRFMVMRPSQSTTSDLTILNDQQLAQTYIQLITTKPVLDAASKDLGFVIDAKKQLQVQQVGTTQVIQLSAEDQDPIRSASIANTLLQSLINQNENLQAGRYTTAEQSLQAQIDQVQSEITVLQSQVNQVSFQTVQDQLASLKTQIDPLQEEVTDLDKQIAGLQPTTSLTNRTKIAEAQARLDQIEPLLSLYQKIYSDLVVLGKPSDVVNDQSARLAQLQSTLDLYQKVYLNLLDNQSSVRLARLQNTPNVVQIDQAVVPDIPIRPRPLTNTLLAGAVGLMLTGGIAFLIEYLDDTIKTPEDVERILDTSVIGYIAQMQYSENSDEGIYVVRQPRSPVSEAFRSLRTNLEYSSIDKPLRKILITSSNPNEGKTTIAVNLAAIIAQGGKSVVLMDADLRKPQVHRFLGLPNRTGLSDLFRNSISVDAIFQTFEGLENVSIITSGSLPPNPTELLASTRMDQIFKEIDKNSQIVIVDSPPSLVADIQVLAAKVDGVLMVVQPGHTQIQDARATMEQLKRAGARVVGVIFNRIPRDRPYYYGGYRHYSPYYNGGYHYYASQQDNNGVKPGKKTGVSHNKLSRLFIFSKNGKSHKREQAKKEPLVDGR